MLRNTFLRVSDVSLSKSMFPEDQGFVFFTHVLTNLV